MDEKPSTPAEESPQIKLTLPATELIENVLSRSPSPTQKRNQLLPTTTTTKTNEKSTNLQTKCDTSLNIGSATGIVFHQYYAFVFLFIFPFAINYISTLAPCQFITMQIVHPNLYLCTYIHVCVLISDKSRAKKVHAESLKQYTLLCIVNH